MSIPNTVVVDTTSIKVVSGGTQGAGGPGFVVQSANTVQAGPTSGAAALPTFRTLVVGDLPSTVILSTGSYSDPAWLTAVSAAKVTGTLSTGNLPGTVVLTSGSYANPTWITSLASSKLTGTILAANGGTGLDGSAAANGKLLIGNGSGYTLANITQGSGMTVTNGAGSITLANAGVTSLAGTTNQVSVSGSTGAITLTTPQNTHTGATPQFATLTLVSPSTSSIVQINRGISSQTGDLHEWQNSSSTVLAKVTSAGGLGVSSDITALGSGCNIGSATTPFLQVNASAIDPGTSLVNLLGGDGGFEDASNIQSGWAYTFGGADTTTKDTATVKFGIRSQKFVYSSTNGNASSGFRYSIPTSKATSNGSTWTLSMYVYGTGFGTSGQFNVSLGDTLGAFASFSAQSFSLGQWNQIVVSGTDHNNGSAFNVNIQLIRPSAGTMTVNIDSAIVVNGTYTAATLPPYWENTQSVVMNHGASCLSSPFSAYFGLVGSPSYSFAGDLTTGRYLVSMGNMRDTCGGIDVFGYHSEQSVRSKWIKLINSTGKTNAFGSDGEFSDDSSSNNWTSAGTMTLSKVSSPTSYTGAAKVLKTSSTSSSGTATSKVLGTANGSRWYFTLAMYVDGSVSWNNTTLFFEVFDGASALTMTPNGRSNIQVSGGGADYTIGVGAWNVIKFSALDNNDGGSIKLKLSYQGGFVTNPTIIYLDGVLAVAGADTLFAAGNSAASQPPFYNNDEALTVTDKVQFLGSYAQVAPGSVSVPSLASHAYPTTGLYWPSNDALAITCNGVQTALLPKAGGLVVGNGSSALATNATDGFLYLPTCAGAPSGTPTAQTASCATVYDTSNNKLYVYNGAWKSVTLA